RYDQQGAYLLPSVLRAPAYNPNSGTFYFGAFGYGVPKPTDYYPAAWQWFATQDAATPPELRPAFLSWWDYGFEAVDRGVHPTVADNFQDGYQVSGQFITAQNESAGIAILVRLLEADFRLNHQNFQPAVIAALQSAGWPVGARRCPVSARNTALFYAPVKLSDHRVLKLPDGRILPFEFFQILANTNRGQNIPIQFVAPGDQVQSQTIQYQSAFYNSMFY